MVQVSCVYPGANAKVVADTVAAPIEQVVNGVDNLLYMSSQSTNDGGYVLFLTFKVGTDLNIALVQVQNRVQLAMPLLPQQVQKQGVNIKKKSPDILLAVSFISPDGRYDEVYLSNYATLQVKDELLRLYGVGDVVYLGQRDYSMRVWLDPEQLATRGLTAEEVVQAVAHQNQQVVCGCVGQQPSPRGQQVQVTLSAPGRLTTPGEFGNLIVKTGSVPAQGPDTAVVRLRDLARIELDAQQHDQICTLDGRGSVSIAVFQVPGTNALETAKGVRKKMEELKTRFPDGVDYQIVYDTTPFIRESMSEVVKTLLYAILLVAVVVIVFLQNWRAALIPLISVPVAVAGPFAAVAAFGFSLYTLSLFGLVLAIGIVVDDAIVVVENVERWLAKGLAPRQAAARAMEEVTGPVIGVALVLAAVFIPCAFMAGIVGQCFRQFALTIAVSTVISALNSLTLSPALAALLLRPHGARRDPLTWLLDLTLGWFFRLFNWGFDRATNIYVRMVGLFLRGSVISLLIYGGLLYLTYWSFARAPTGFIPEQDKGYLIVNVQLPDGASVQRTREVMDRIGAIAQDTPGVSHTVAISGQSVLLNANASNWGQLYVMLEPFQDRRGPALQSAAIADRLRQRCQRDIREAAGTVFGAPPVDGLGTVAGFKLIVEDRGGFGQNRLQGVADALVAEGNQTPGLQGLFTNLRSDTPWMYLDVDRTKVKSLGVEIQDVFETLQVNLGSYYVNNFNRFGRS